MEGWTKVYKGLYEGVQRYARVSGGVNCLSLLTIDLVGDNREIEAYFEVLYPFWVVDSLRTLKVQHYLSLVTIGCPSTHLLCTSAYLHAPLCTSIHLSTHLIITLYSSVCLHTPLHTYLYPSTHFHAPLCTSALLHIPLCTQQYPLHTSMHLCTPLHTSMHLCTPPHTSMHLCIPLCALLHTCAYLCIPLHISVHLFVPLHTFAYLCAHQHTFA